MNSIPSPSPAPELPAPALPNKPRPLGGTMRNFVIVFTLASVAAALAVGIFIGRSLSSRSGGDPMAVAGRGDPQLHYTLQAMQVSATIGDWEGFSRYVDIPAFRSSIREVARSGLAEARRKGEAGMIDSALGDLLVGVLLDKYVTEQGLPQVMRAVSLALAIAGNGQERDSSIRRHAYFAGSDSFVLARENVSEAGAYLVFRRSPSRGWQLAGMTNKKP